MKISIKTAQGYLSAQPVADGHIVRWEYRDIPEPGEWETFDLEGFEFPKPPDPPVPPPVDTWPPPPGTNPPMPPDIDTVNVEEVRKRVQWALWHYNCSDDESYWMNAIVLKPEPGHTPGWTASGYWRTDKIAVAEGVGRGYVWPAQ